MELKSVLTLEGVLRAVAKHKTCARIVPHVSEEGDLRFYLFCSKLPGETVDFLAQGNVVVHLPFSADAKVSMPEELTPLRMYLDLSDEVLDGQGQPRSPAYDNLSELMSNIPPSTAVPVQVVTTEPEIWVVKTFGPGTTELPLMTRFTAFRQQEAAAAFAAISSEPHNA